MFKYSLSISIGDGYTDNTYYFKSPTGNYSIEFLAGIIQGATDLRLIQPTEALKDRRLRRITNKEQRKAGASCAHEWVSGMFSHICKKCGRIDDA